MKVVPLWRECGDSFCERRNYFVWGGMDAIARMELTPNEA